MNSIPELSPSEKPSDCLQTPAQIQIMFGNVAPRYDFFNRLLSFGLDIQWRNRLVKAALSDKPNVILDLATGTGDVLRELQKAAASYGGLAFGIDFSLPMLEQAKNKGIPNLCLGNAMELPCQKHSIDVITLAFGLRNFPDRKKFFHQALRTLKNNGKLLILEFSQPYRIFAPFYFFYLDHILPQMARLLQADAYAYRYLSESILQFPSKTKLKTELVEAGFSQVTIQSFCLGAVALHQAYPPGRTSEGG